MKVAFHDNLLCVRGTTTALWDYAEWSQKLFNIEPIIIYNQSNIYNQDFVVERFRSRYKVFGYKHDQFQPHFQGANQINEILKDNNCESLFMIKGGNPDGVISTVSKNWINAISICNESHIHGDRFAMGSRWLSRITDNKIDYVSYMVNLPDVDGDLRESLGIPKNAIVFGRNGGSDQFDLKFVHSAIEQALKIRKDIYFLFQGTDKFIEHERIIYLAPSVDVDYKVKFINTCDALIHARQIGESFGMTCAEFSMKNKPVITWFGSRERNHIEYLDNKGIYFNNYDDILHIFSKFEPNSSVDYRCYEECLPEFVMDKFKKIYLN
jgi:hypothetical protein